MSELVIGVDIGGTKVATVAADEAGRIVGKATRASKPGTKPMLEAIAAGIEGALADGGVKRDHIRAIGIGAPGPVDPWDGLWWGSTNLPIDAPPFPLAQEVQAQWGRPTYIENDVKAAGLGEYYFGRGTTLRPSNDEGTKRDCTSLLFVSVGTGLAATLIVDGEVFRGRQDAGEIGHIPVDRDGFPCRCGQRGCLETIAAGRALTRWGREVVEAGWSPALSEACDHQPDTLHGGHVVAAAQAGDGAATELIERLAEGIALAVVTGWRAYDPGLIVLGGGVIIGGGEFLFGRIEQAIERIAPGYIEVKALCRTRLGADAGALGAAAVALTGERATK